MLSNILNNILLEVSLLCWMVAIPIAMAVGQQVMSSMSSNEAAAAQVDQQRRQKIEMIKQMNYNDANLKLEDRQNYENTVQELSQNNMTNVRNMGTVKAAIGESNLAGNSMDRIQRVTEGDMLRQAAGVNENYEKDYASILGKRIGNTQSTINQFNTMKEPKVRSSLSVLLDPLNIGSNRLLSPITGKINQKIESKLDSKTGQ